MARSDNYILESLDPLVFRGPGEPGRRVVDKKQKAKNRKRRKESKRQNRKNRK